MARPSEPNNRADAATAQLRAALQRAERAEADNRWLEAELKRLEGLAARPTGGAGESNTALKAEIARLTAELTGLRRSLAAAEKAREAAEAALRAERAAKVETRLSGDPAGSGDMPEPEETGDPIAELDALVGLASVKEEVKNLAALARIRAERLKAGLKPTPFSLHLVFTGNPGTGKTTVARIVARLYRQIGLLKRGHLVEVSRADLVAEYLGQTAPKTRAVIEDALDGVLFIDEAYSLHRGDGRRDYGSEAIEELLRALDNHRDRLVVILAGYAKETAGLIASNPGLASRFTTAIDFADYGPDELFAIFLGLCHAGGYRPSAEAMGKARAGFYVMHSRKGAHFGNGRSVRGYFEDVLKRQARRLSETPGRGRGALSRDALSAIEAEDVPSP